MISSLAVIVTAFVHDVVEQIRAICIPLTKACTDFRVRSMDVVAEKNAS